MLVCDVLELKQVVLFLTLQCSNNFSF